MATDWKMGEVDDIAANITAIKWTHPGTGATITETNKEGLTYLFERVVIAADGVHASVQEAVACYGFAEAYADKVGLDRWFDVVLAALGASSMSSRGQHDLCAVHKGFTCDQMFHAGAYRLGNESCEGCDACAWIESLA